MGEGEQFRLARQASIEGVPVEPALLVDFDPVELGPGLFGDQVPGNDVRMVLHLRDEHLVARLHSVERAREVRRYIQYDPQPPV